jgi:hypothetical protein
LIKKTAVPLCKKETGHQQFVVDLQVMCIIEGLSLQMFLAALGWLRFGLVQTLQRLYLKTRLFSNVIGLD